VAQQRGHCNPKAALIKTLFMAAGLPVRTRAIPIHLDPLIFFWPNHIGSSIIGPRLTGIHQYTEVEIGGKYVTIDSYVVDKTLLVGSKARLAREKVRVGHFGHIDGESDWDGDSKCMSQYVDDEIKVKGGFDVVVDDPDEFYTSDKYPQRGVDLRGWFGKIFLSIINGKIDRVRAEGDAILNPKKK
jgi:hypothetical protein